MQGKTVWLTPITRPYTSIMLHSHNVYIHHSQIILLYLTTDKLALPNLNRCKPYDIESLNAIATQ